MQIHPADPIGRGPSGNGSDISPLVELFGEIEVGAHCFVAGNTILVADEGMRVSLGDENNRGTTPTCWRGRATASSAARSRPPTRR